MKGKSTKELEQLKHLNLKIKATSKKCRDHWEKCQTICMTNQNKPIRGIYLRKLSLILTDEPLSQFNDPILENTFVDNWKWMIKIINNRYK